MVCLLTGPGATEREHEALVSLVAGVTARLVLHEGGLSSLLCNQACFPIEPALGSSALDLVLDRLATLPFEAQHDSTERGASLAIALARATGAILAIAGNPEAYASTIVDAKHRGVSCLWLQVSEEVKSGATDAQRRFISCQSIEELEVLRL